MLIIPLIIIQELTDIMKSLHSRNKYASDNLFPYYKKKHKGQIQSKVRGASRIGRPLRGPGRIGEPIIGRDSIGHGATTFNPDYQLRRRRLLY
jgi:hypothetical protein